jgi:hypothetical protein
MTQRSKLLVGNISGGETGRARRVVLRGRRAAPRCRAELSGAAPRRNTAVGIGVPTYAAVAVAASKRSLVGFSTPIAVFGDKPAPR